jgi:hypothetical protein
MGLLVERIGERKALTLDILGLIIISLGYAVVESMNIALVLYILDNVFFSISFAIIHTPEIADPADIASTAGISFTINHIAAVYYRLSWG